MSSFLKAVSSIYDVERHIRVDICHEVVENGDDKDVANILIHLPYQRYLELLVEFLKAGVTGHVVSWALSRVEYRTRGVERCMEAVN